MSFDHRAHVRAAWEAVDRHGLAAAAARIPAFLQGFTAAAGVPERYHETVTWGWLLIVADRMIEGEGFEAFADRNPDLFDGSPILARFWRPETLASDRARRRFVFPDRIAQ